MNKLFKKLARMMAIIILCLTCSSWTEIPSENTVTGHSTCDEDLKKLKINLNEYSKYENKLILMAEVEKNFLILYFYNTSDNNNYKSLDFNYSSTELESSLEDLELEHKIENVTLISTSSDGLVDKLCVKFKTEGKYRKYEIRQLITGDGTSSYTIGDSYIFTDNSSGGVDYEVSKLEYITFEDVKIYDYYIDESDFGSGFWSSYNGKHVYFYAFTLNDFYKFLIHDLEKVTFSYYQHDLDAIMYPDNDATSDTAGIGNPKREMEIFDYEKESYTNWWDETGQTLNFTTKYTNKTFITSEEVSGRTYTVETPTMFFSKTTNSWNSIMKYSEIENVVTGEKLKSKLLEDFKGYDYIISLKVYDYELEKNNMSIIPSEDYSKIGRDVNVSARYQYLSTFPISGIDIYNEDITWALYAPYIHVFNTKAITEAQIIRMFFRDILGNPYDLEVITTPQNSSGSALIDGDENPSWWEDFIKTIIAVIVVVIIFILLIAYFPYVWNFIVFIFKKLIPFIKNIFVGIFNFFKKLFTRKEKKKKE